MITTRVIFAGGTGEHVLVTELRAMTLNGLFCADALRPLDLVPLTDFTYKYRTGNDDDDAILTCAGKSGS